MHLTLPTLDGLTAEGLWPEINPYVEGMLPVGDGHTLWWAEYGNPDGLPVVMLHGGPGSGCSPKFPRRFDPTKWRVVCFDQRGAGKSTPSGELAANTTADLVADVVRVMAARGLEKAVICGHSWGSTLALAFARAHPAQVLGLAVGGVFLGMTAEEYNWFSQPHGGVAMLHPEAYAALMAVLGHPAPADLFSAAAAAVAGPDPVQALAVAKAWGRVEGLLSTPTPNLTELDTLLEGPLTLPFAKIELAYLARGCFLEEGGLLTNLPTHLPCVIWQGTLDFVTPPAAALALHRAWPGSVLHWAPGAGHWSTLALEQVRVPALAALHNYLTGA